MSSLLCLQGGAEFQPDCRAIDSEVLARVSPELVAVTALAGSPGRDYASATARGVRWWRELGAQVSAVPDVRDDPQGALDVLAAASLVVLPGGSPSRLRAALMDTPIGALLSSRWAAGECALVGASAGAMLLCSHALLPDTAGAPVVEGLALLARSLVVPHWSGASAWVAKVTGRVPLGTRVIGLPECSGVVVEGSRWTALGAAPSELVGFGSLTLEESVELP